MEKTLGNAKSTTCSIMKKIEEKGQVKIVKDGEGRKCLWTDLKTNFCTWLEKTDEELTKT